MLVPARASARRSAPSPRSPTSTSTSPAGQVVAIVGRQRRRQVDAGQGARRASTRPTRARSPSRAGRSRSPTPAPPSTSGIATVFQDLALCENLNVVENLFLGQELRPARLNEVDMEVRSWELLRAAVGEDPDGPHPGRVALGRPAADRGHRPVAARRPEAHHPRRAHRRPGRRPDRRGAQPDRAAARARARRDHDQPQHGRRAGRGRHGRASCASGATTACSTCDDVSAEEIVAAITGASDNVVARRACRGRAARRPPARPRGG